MIPFNTVRPDASPDRASAHGHHDLSGGADALPERMMASLIGDQSPNDQFGVFRGRAVALLGAITPPLAWMRDAMGIASDVDRIRLALELPSIWALAMEKQLRVRDSDTGAIEEISVPDIPEDIIDPLRAYLGELPGCDLTLPYNQQNTVTPSQHHGYALFYVTSAFATAASAQN